MTVDLVNVNVMLSALSPGKKKNQHNPKLGLLIPAMLTWVWYGPQEAIDVVQGSRQGERKGRGPGQVKVEEVSDQLGLSWHLNAEEVWPCAKLLLKRGKLRGTISCGQPNLQVMWSWKGFSSCKNS